MRYATIGGQAVIEGVMMRNGNDYAVAVRKPDQTIEVKKDQYIGLNARWHMKKIPIIQGCAGHLLILLCWVCLH